MGRGRVRIPFSAEKLRELMKGNERWSERAEKYGVSRQAVSNWLYEGLIPPRALFEIFRDLGFSSEDMDAVLLKTSKVHKECDLGDTIEIEIPKFTIRVRLSKPTPAPPTSEGEEKNG